LCHCVDIDLDEVMSDLGKILLILKGANLGVTQDHKVTLIY